MKRNYSNTAVETTLAADIDSATSSVVVLETDGWPPVPFTILIDADQASEEVCLVTAKSIGGSLTVTRGWDGSTPLQHSAGAVVKHAAVAADFREANDVASVFDGTWGSIKAAYTTP